MLVRSTHAAVLGLALLFSTAAVQAQTYTKVSGANIDFYYDAAAFGGTLTVSGNSLLFSYGSADTFLGNTDLYPTPLVVVAHQGYQLSHYYSASTTGTATLVGQGSVDAWVNSTIHGGVFSNNSFQQQYYGVAGYSADYSMPYFDYQDDGQGNLSPLTTTFNFNSSDNTWNHDYDSSVNFSAYAVDFQGAASAYSQGVPTTVSNRTLGFSFAVNASGPVAAVPEAETWLMLSAGLALLGARARKRRAA